MTQGDILGPAPADWFKPGPRDTSKPCQLGKKRFAYGGGVTAVRCEAHDYPAFEETGACLIGAMDKEALDV